MASSFEAKTLPLGRTIVHCLITWLGLASCATMVQGTTQELQFKSSPDDAIVTLTKKVIDDEFEDKWHGESRVLGKTPLTIEVKRDEDHFVTFTKEGFKPETVNLTTEVEGWFWGNIFFGGIIGSAVDGLSGALHEYSPDQFFVVLVPEAATRVEGATLKSQRDKAREFMVRQHANLVESLIRGGGEELDALLRMLNVQSGQEEVARKKLRSLSELYESPADFADHAAALFLK